MHIICSLSSLSFTCEHFPGSLSQREISHPVFALPQKRLLSTISRWADQDAGKFTQVDSYLLFLALLKSTGLVEFRAPAIRTESTDSIVFQNMESLALTVSRLATVRDVETTFPHYVISYGHQSLDNVDSWILNWNESYNDFKAGKLRDIEGRDEWKRLVIRENALQRLIKNPHRPVSSYSQQLADWACIAGSFPEFVITNPFPPFQKISCADYWCSLIHKAAHSDHLFSIRRADLEELLAHCEDKISAGSIYSDMLFKVLRHALDKQKNYLGLGDLDISGSKFVILNPGDSTEAANIQAMVDMAPAEFPRREMYKTQFDFMRAKLRWNMSKKFGSMDASTSGQVQSQESGNTGEE